RLQVEHPVTEMVTGIDLVCEQIRIAAGEPLTIRQEDVRWHGSAIECRVYAEDPDRQFLPSPGRISMLRTPAGPGVRDDSGVYEGWEVPIHYDPMISKLATWGATRAEAISRMRRALDEYIVSGIHTTIPFFRRVLADPDFVAGRIDTDYIARRLAHHLTTAPETTTLETASTDDLDDEQLAAAIVATLTHLVGGPERDSQPNQTPSRESLWKLAARQSILRK
ncbi:MAG: acetyl-CoA carboxylase biotin carboxylase subunit, partial [Acidobacteriota bacterium]